MHAFDDCLLIDRLPEPPAPRMLVALRGWADAGDAATATLGYLLTTLGAVKFAEIDPEEFFNFAQERPRSVRTKDGQRHLQWPANEFYLWPGAEDAPPAVFYLGTEPHLRWRTFASLVGELAQRCGVRTAVQIGALRDAVPHTRPVRFSGSTGDRGIRDDFRRQRIRASGYQGPTGITQPIAAALAARGIGYTSLWGHVPHYLHATPNYRVGLGLARRLADLLPLPIDLGRLYTMADAFDAEIGRAIAEDRQLQAYILTLEERYDQAAGSSGDAVPDPAALVRDLEQFLRAERQSGRGE